jgi:hypothetical protein
LSNRTRPSSAAARTVRVGDEHVGPAAAGFDASDVQDLAREPFEEETGLDVVLRGLLEQPVAALPERLVPVRDELDHHVEVGRQDDEAQRTDGPEQPPGADAAGEQGHALAVSGEPAQGHQHPGQERHRNRDAERLRQQVDEECGNRGGLDPFGEQRAGLFEHGPDAKDEGEDGQRQQERRQGLANEVAVEGPHGDAPVGRILDDWPSTIRPQAPISRLILNV